MDWQEMLQEWGWLSGPAMGGAWMLVGGLRWLLRPSPPVELTEPARNLIASLLDPKEKGWGIHLKCSSLLCKGTIVVDTRDGEIIRCDGTDLFKLGYLKENAQVKTAANKRLLRLQEQARE